MPSQELLGRSRVDASLYLFYLVSFESIESNMFFLFHLFYFVVALSFISCSN